jgi:redox-regulated HSP33 family molecular chaperone
MVENGVLRVTCEFCKTDYLFDEPALSALCAC